MSTFKANPADARSCIPKGEYVVIVTKMIEKMGKPKPDKQQYPYFETTLEVASGQFEGWPIVDRLSLSPEASFRIGGFVKASGLAQESGEQEFESENFIGRILCIKGDVEENAQFGDKFRVGSYWMHPDVAKELGLAETTLPGAAAAEPEAAVVEEPAPAPAPVKAAATVVKRVLPPAVKKTVKV
jgi:hypothetical protein